jgi:hypothetical protein
MMEEIHVAVINLRSRPDRRIEMERQLARIGWQARFEDAIRPSDRGDFPSIGARGCFLSHLALLRRSIGITRLVILEDDVNFAGDFSRRWQAMRRELETKDWSICYPWNAVSGATAGLQLLDPSDPIRCTHFMLIHRDAIPILIEGLEAILSRPAGHPDGGPMHVDAAYWTIRSQNPKLNSYVFSPPLGYQRPSRTDIAELKWFDRIDALRPIVGALRKLKPKGFEN